MARFLIAGLVNVETTLQVRQFPIEYYPIDYPFFGGNTAVSGVAFNIASALHTLGRLVFAFSMMLIAISRSAVLPNRIMHPS